MAINIPVFQARPIDEPGIGDFLNPLMQAVRQKQQGDASESRFARELQLKHDQLAEQQKYHQDQIEGINTYRKGIIAAHMVAAKAKQEAGPVLSDSQKTRLAAANKAMANLQSSYDAYDILIDHIKKNPVLFKSPVQSRMAGGTHGGDWIENTLVGGNSDFNIANNQYKAKITSVAETLLNAGALPKNIVTVEAAVQAIAGGLISFAGMNQNQGIALLKEARDSFLTPMRRRAMQNIWQAKNPGAVYPGQGATQALASYSSSGQGTAPTPGQSLATQPPGQGTPPTPGQGTTQPSDQVTLASIQRQRADQQRQFEMMQAKLNELGG